MMFLTKYKTTRQIGPDEYQTYYEEKLWPDTTTIGQIKQWAISTYKYKDIGKMSPIILSEPNIDIGEM